MLRHQPEHARGFYGVLMRKFWVFLTAAALLFSAAGLAEEEEDLAIDEIVEDVILDEDGAEDRKSVV